MEKKPEATISGLEFRLEEFSPIMEKNGKWRMTWKLPFRILVEDGESNEKTIWTVKQSPGS